MRPHAAQRGELLGWLASAREWLGELADEGVERIETARETDVHALLAQAFAERDHRLAQ